MNDIETIKDAIEHFRYGIDYDIFSKPVTAYAKLAIEALQEKQEREKTYEIIEKVQKIKDYESVSYLCSGCNWNIAIQDKFCKHCGRKLGEK